MLKDPANPRRVSGTNVVAMSGRLAALALVVAGQLDLPWLERVVQSPEAWAAVIWLLAEGFYFLRRAVARVEKLIQQRSIR